MAVKDWNGSVGSYYDAGNWSPSGVPLRGDIATISRGTVMSRRFGIIASVELLSSSTAAGTLTLDTDLVAGVVTLNGTNAAGAGPAPTLIIAGNSVIETALNLTGSNSQVVLDAELINSATITVNGDSSRIQSVLGGTTFPDLFNEGVISINHLTQFEFGASSQNAVFDVGVTGTGTISLMDGAEAEFTRAVNVGQTVILSGHSQLVVDRPNLFKPAAVGGLSGQNSLVLRTDFTGANYATTGARSGVLTLYDGANATVALTLSGVYTLDSFRFDTAAGGSSGPTVTISTAIVDPSSGLLSGSAHGPVYRFFDRSTGVHLYTADLSERSALLQTRTDLVEEKNTFGSVDPAGFNASPVFRFFDTTTGTQFLTASSQERDTLVASRPDLVYEPSSTLYEAVTPGTYDPVYRFYNTVNGSHFYTNNAQEYAAVTNAPAPATYRPDLVFEQIAFYAPVATFV